MPRVEIPGVGIVRFPDNMSREDIMSQATAMQQKASQPIFDPKDLPTSELIKGGFSRGIEGLKGTAFDLIPALAGSIIGKDDYAKEQLKEYRDRMAAAEAESPTAYKSYKDIGSIGQAFDFAAETIGELGPDIASFMVGAGVGTTAGKVIAKKALEKEIREQAAETAAKRGLDDAAEKALADRLMSRAKQGAVGAKATEAGANVGLKTGLWGSSMGLNVPDVLNSVYEDTGELSPGIALTIGSLVAALDTYLPQKILSQLSPSAKERIAAEMLQKSSLVPTTWKRAFGAEVLKTSTGEALTEAAQEAITKLGSQIAGDKDPFFSQENIDQILTASLKGFIGGGTFGTPGAAFEAKRITDERDRQIAQRAAQQTPPTTPGAAPSFQQVETDPNKVPKQVAPGIIYDPKTGTYVQQSEAVEPLGREMAQQVPPEMGTPELVGMGAPAVDFTQAEMFGTPAFEKPAPTTEQALAGPPTAPAEFATVLTPEVLKDTGLKPQSGFYKKLLNKDMANPEDQATVRDTLVEIRQNKNLTDSTKEATERIAMQAFGALAQQQEMFGPRGGVLKGADYGRVQPGPVGGAGGAGVSVPSEREGEGAPAGVTTPGEQGLAPTTEAADVAPSREELQPGALTTEEQDALQQELAAEMGGEPTTQAAPAPKAPAVGVSEGVPEGISPAVTAPTTQATPAEAVASQAAAKAPKAIRTEKGNLEFQELGRPSETNFTDFIGKGYLGFAREDIQDIDDTLKITDVVQGKFGVNPMLNAAKIYFSKMSRTIDNIINIAFDMAFDTPAFRQSPDDPLAADEVAFFRGMSGKNARFAHTWVLQNLSPEAQQKMRDFIRGFEIARDNYSNEELMDLIRSGVSGIKENYSNETAKSYVEGQAAENAAARTRAQRRAIFPNQEERRKTIAEQEAFEKELAEIKGKKARKFLEMPEFPFEIAGLSNKTINSIFSHHADRDKPSRAGAYIGYVNPSQFLRATTGSQRQIDEIKAEAVKRIGKLDPSKIIDYTNSPMNLVISKREGTDYYEITGHEGRHRMAALAAAGVDTIPVVFKLRNYEPPGAKPLTSTYIAPQNQDGKGFIVSKLLPVSYDYKQEVEANFGPIESKNQVLFQNPIAQLSMPIHPAIAARIMTGDLVGALRMLSANPNNFIARAASRLANANLQTKLVVQENLYNDAGKPVPGYYDPNNDTIYIDPNSGMNVHTLLHEAGHAATSHVMDNPSHPLTKQVAGLLEKIRDSLGSAYGATSPDEFLAEAQSNTEFKALLQSIYPDGKPISAWDQLVRMISNFMRRLFGMEPRPSESAFDQVDRFINAMISPAPESRDAGILYSAANTGMASKVFDRLGTSLEALPGMTPARADNIHEFLKNTVGGNFRSFMLSVLPLNALSDVAASKGLKDAPLVDRLVNERSGYEYKLNEKIEPVVKQAEDFAKKESQAQVDLFNKVVYDSTLNKVDPTKPRTDYKTPEEQKAYDEVKANYNKLGGAGKALYVTMRDAYKEMYQRILDTIGERIDASVTDPARAKVIKKDIYERLVTKGRIDPYFPLARYGKYWLSYSARDDAGQMEFYVEAFETERERARYMEQLGQSGAQDVQAFSNLSELNYRRVPAGSFVNGVLQVMELNKVPPEATEEVLRLFLSTLPETAFAQSFQRRKETLGFNKDAIRALRERVYRTSHQLASMRYASKLNEVLDNMKEYARGVGKGAGDEAQRDNRVINEYVKEFEKRISYINNPTVAKWSQVATSFGFNMTLGFNVSSAVINLTQVPLILYPYLAGTYGYGATSRAISDAYKIYLNSGFNREVELIGSNGQRVRQKAMPALDNYDFDAPNLPPEVKRLRTLARVARDQGQLNRSQLYDILEVDERNNALSKVNAASGFIFHHGERLNRQVSLIAAYNLDLNRMMTKPTKEEAGLTQEQKEEKAANHAVYTAELTNGGISAAAAPRIAQSSLGKVLFMFKRYGVSMYYLLFKTAREALKGETPEIRKAAMNQIAGIYGTAALFAGIQGLPMFGIAAMVYNMFADDDEDDFETATRKYLGEVPYKGLLNYVTNVEIASRTGLSDLIIRDSGKQDSQTVALTMMEMLGGPVFGVASRVERGLDMIRDGNVQRGIENILPSSLGNILKGIRYSTEGTTTLRGDPITGEVNPWNVAVQAFGFAPADYTRQLEINNRQKGIDKSVNQEETKLKRQYYTATRMGDSQGRKEARDKLLELGVKHPSLEINPGTIGDVLDRSIEAQKRVTERMRNGVAYSPKMLKEIEQNLREYD